MPGSTMSGRTLGKYLVIISRMGANKDGTVEQTTMSLTESSSLTND
jgi:hypothetical protein